RFVAAPVRQRSDMSASAKKAPRVRVRVCLEPIVRLTALLFAALKINLVRATCDFPVRCRVPDRNLQRRRLFGGCFGLCTFISFSDDIFISFFLVWLLLSCRRLCTLRDSVPCN